MDVQKIVEEAYHSRDTGKKRPHYHHSHQILLILRGGIRICVNGVTQEAGPGSLVLFSRYENHSVAVLTEEYDRYVLQLDPPGDDESRIFSVLSNRPAGFCNVVDVSRCIGEFESLFQSIIREYAGGEKLAEDMQLLLARQLMILILRQMPGLPEVYEGEKYTPIFDIQRRFEKDFAGHFTLEALARDYALSVSSLSHRFKALTGVSVMDYLLSCRIAAAKRYLTDTQLGIGQIVEQCGFSNSSNFSRTFKKLTGLSPSDFRERYGHV